jgi:ribonuclease HIII
MRSIEVLDDKPVTDKEIIKLAQQIVKQIKDNEKRTTKL